VAGDGKTSYEVTATSTAPPERVFDVLADGAGWSRWAGAMVVRSWWEREGEPAPGGVGAIRALGLPKLGSREEIVAYERPSHLAYIVLSGLPAKNYRADVHLTPDGEGTRITWGGSFVPKVPGTGALIRGFLIRTVGAFARRLAAEAERT
jgi:uncharacterized protein YndB with AHSA1/START domain